MPELSHALIDTPIVAQGMKPSSPRTFLVPIASFWLLLLVLLPDGTFIRDGDTFWHIRTGEWILNHIDVPHADFYSFTFAGARWIDAEWLAEVLMALIYQHLGWAGLTLLTACLCALALSIQCYYLVATIRFSAAVLWTLATAFFMSPHFLARPHVFSFVALSLWLTALVRSWDGDRFEPPLALFCAIMAAWANLHGSFLFGYFLFIIFCGYSFFADFSKGDYAQARRMAFVALLVGCCALATPYGIETALLTFQVLQLHYVLAHVSEWKSPDFQTFGPHMMYLVAMLAAGLAFGLRVRGPRLPVLSLLLVLALSHLRGLFLLFLALPILVAVPLKHSCPWLGSDVLFSKSRLAALSQYSRATRVAQLAFPLLVVVVLIARWPSLSIGPSQSLAPARAVDFLERNRGSGNVFNGYRFGGYLIFRNIPVFVDSRTPPYSDSFMQRTLDAANAVDLGDALRLLDEYRIRWVLLEPSEPLGKALGLSPNWKTVYSDQYSVLFERSVAANAAPDLSTH